MKIVKGATRAEVHWTARQLVEYVKDGIVDFNIDIQRGYVWKDIERKSAFIRSLILIDIFLRYILTRLKISMRRRRKTTNFDYCKVHE